VDTRERLYDFLFVGLWCGIAAWGMQFLPAGDYQPSRPFYAACWLLAAVGLFVVSKNYPAWLRSAAKWLVGIFAFLLVISSLM
jgi:hypothetical protein